MNIGTFYGTVRKCGDLTFDISTSSSSHEADGSNSDMELSDDSDSDDSESHIDSDDHGLSETSLDLQHVRKFSSKTD